MPFILHPRRLASTTVLAASLAATLTLSTNAAAQSNGNRPGVLTYPPYEQSGGPAGDPFTEAANGGYAGCQAQYASKVQQIDQKFRAGQQACHFPGNGQCIAGNKSEKASGLQAAGAEHRLCNQQVAQQKQNQKSATQPAGSQPGRETPNRVDYDAIKRLQDEQAARAAAGYQRSLEQARARAAEASRAAAAARAADRARKWEEANRFVDVLTGRRPPFLP